MVDIDALLKLKRKLNDCLQQDYPAHSRIHPLLSFHTKKTNCFVKRDDELGFGISGSKFRKYRTLVPYLLEEEKKQLSEIILLGGPFSNHMLSLTQLLLENKISPTLFLQGNEPIEKKGNFLLLSMLLPLSSMRWVSRQAWQEVNGLIFNYLAKKNVNGIIVPEGGNCFPAFPGALTLALDIIDNEKEKNITFDHLFMDTGTGFSAAALLLGFAFLKKEIMCHLLLVAGSEDDFLGLLKELHGQFEEWLQEECPFPTCFHCLKSELAPSFGSTNKAVFDFLVQMARSDGIFLDPIYSGKLFYHSKRLMENPDSNIQGNALIIHSGGALTLMGFQAQIGNSITTNKL